MCDNNDTKIDLEKYDILVDAKYYKLIEKIMSCSLLNKLYRGRCFGIESNNKRLTENKKSLKCYVSQQKGFIKYIDPEQVKKHYKYWKVIVTEANGGNKCFGNIFIGTPNEIHTGSYISFEVKSEKEAESLVSYLKCKFTNLLLSIRKISQHINEFVCKWIPLPPLDRIWTDKHLFEYYKLDKEEIELVKNTNIKGYKN